MGPHHPPRGILNERLGRTKFDYEVRPPAEHLRGFVMHHWTVRWDLFGEPAHQQRVLPNLSVHVVFGGKDSGIFGPSRETFCYELTGVAQVLGMRFRPGTFRPLLKRPVGSLAGTPLPLSEVFGERAAVTAELIAKAGTTGEMAELAEGLVSSCLPEPDIAAQRVNEVLETLAADPGITRVATLGERTGYSARSLQRLFHEHVGVSPKQAIRVHRLAEAAQRIATGEIDFPALAAELGYSDQAHFTREFTAATGTPPGRGRAEWSAPHRR